MVSPHLGKRYRMLLRAPIALALPHAAGDTQYGGISGRGVDLAALALRSFQNIAAGKKQSAVFLMVDAVQAFYKAARQLVMDSSLARDELASMLQAAKLPPSAMHNIMENIHTQDNTLERSGISQHVRALAATSYHGA
eukprot:268576-Pyramimonas_sp.AAC.1